jgi:hypothetical protein
LQLPGLVALLGSLLCASSASGGGSGGDGEEREAAAQAEGRRGGDEKTEAELGLGPWRGVEDERGLEAGGRHGRRRSSSSSSHGRWVG